MDLAHRKLKDWRSAGPCAAVYTFNRRQVLGERHGQMLDQHYRRHPHRVHCHDGSDGKGVLGGYRNGRMSCSSRRNGARQERNRTDRYSQFINLDARPASLLGSSSLFAKNLKVVKAKVRDAEQSQLERSERQPASRSGQRLSQAALWRGRIAGVQGFSYDCPVDRHTRADYCYRWQDRALNFSWRDSRRLSHRHRGYVQWLSKARLSRGSIRYPPHPRR